VLGLKVKREKKKPSEEIRGGEERRAKDEKASLLKVPAINDQQNKKKEKKEQEKGGEGREKRGERGDMSRGRDLKKKSEKLVNKNALKENKRFSGQILRGGGGGGGGGVQWGQKKDRLRGNKKPA